MRGADRSFPSLNDCVSAPLNAMSDFTPLDGECWAVESHSARRIRSIDLLRQYAQCTAACEDGSGLAEVNR